MLPKETVQIHWQITSEKWQRYPSFDLPNTVDEHCKELFNFQTVTVNQVESIA